MVVVLDGAELDPVPFTGTDPVETQEMLEVGAGELFAAHPFPVRFSLPHHDGGQAVDEVVDAAAPRAREFDRGGREEEPARGRDELARGDLGPEEVVEEVADDDRDREVEGGRLSDDPLPRQPDEKEGDEVGKESSDGDAPEVHALPRKAERLRRIGSL